MNFDYIESCFFIMNMRPKIMTRGQSDANFVLQPFVIKKPFQFYIWPVQVWHFDSDVFLNGDILAIKMLTIRLKIFVDTNSVS